MPNSKSIIKEYNQQKELYRDYGQAVKNLLESLLSGGQYKYQLSDRLKSLQSLKEKIERKRQTGKIYKHLKDIEDIMGLRIVFYTEADKKKFMTDLRRALGAKLRVEETAKVSGYRSTHVIVSFDRDRTRLTEYKRFRNLKCEVQMTLILNHAWAEVEHDIFYKDGAEIKSLDKEKYLTFKERMEKVMHDHIRKASLGLENIIKSIHRLQTQKIEQ
jgi:ppGpp synthetase/RelA/SpoT-type nucleotidyltranferase